MSAMIRPELANASTAAALAGASTRSVLGQTTALL
jgi:hypothetical protein